MDRLGQKDRPRGAKRSKPEDAFREARCGSGLDPRTRSNGGRIANLEPTANLKRTPESENSLKEDAELIWSALRGKESAFAKLLKKYRRPVYSLALKMLGQEEDAEDTAQEAFIRAFQSLDTCDPERPFQRWIYRITYNLCVDRYRRKKPFAISLDQTVGEDELQMELVDSAPAPDEVLGMRDEHRKVVELLYSLPPRYRVVVVLRHQEELSYEAIAEILGLPLGTVKARMHRAHNMLRKKLKRRET
ncbi:MAG: sigma-70 family RNA polymerase sigma factor [Candidatus Eisenbacteria bacterium]|nr:sigma-70 family RNA polymerase sigma factor [Candidatus Eisenbacteria bacterium]